MKHIKFFTMAFLATAFCLFSACRKTEGCTDPEALNYNADAEESDGTCVYSNVKSETITVFFEDWQSVTGEINADFWSFRKEVDLLSESVYNEGAVLCYKMHNDVVTALPYSINFGNNSTEHWSFQHTTDTLRVYFTTEGFQATNPGTRIFKIVTIDSKSIESKPGIDFEDYESVSQAFDLE